MPHFAASASREVAIAAHYRGDTEESDWFILQPDDDDDDGPTGSGIHYIPPSESEAYSCMAVARGDLLLFERLYNDERYSYVWRLMALRAAVEHTTDDDEETDDGG